MRLGLKDLWFREVGPFLGFGFKIQEKDDEDPELKLRNAHDVWRKGLQGPAQGRGCKHFGKGQIEHGCSDHQ